MTIGFIGIGVMGQPMAMNLLRAGVRVAAWNRTPSDASRSRSWGRRSQTGPEEVFAAADTVILMMIDEPSTDHVLGRGGAAFEHNVRNHVVVQMGTMSPGYSRDLERDVISAGGRYVEAPVSGSRAPAEQGRLVAMIAGADDATLRQVQSVLQPMCATTVLCGAVPGALSMKLAVNLYMIGMVTALAEAVHFASRMRLDLGAFSEVLQAGPMDSSLARVKAGKLLAADFDVQAAITDVIKNADLVAEAAQNAGIAAPIIDLCSDLYHETADAGWGHLDMVAVVKAFERRSGSRGRGTL